MSRVRLGVERVGIAPHRTARAPQVLVGLTLLRSASAFAPKRSAGRFASSLMATDKETVEAMVNTFGGSRDGSWFTANGTPDF